MSAADRSRNVTAAVLGLWLVVLCVVGAGDMGGQQSRGTLRVLATWTGDEEDAFRHVLEAFTERHHIQVEYQGTTALREVLLSEVNSSGTPPDIAVLPSSGELATYGNDLVDLREVVPGETLSAYGPLWRPALRPGGPVYGIAIKADLKSIVWYDSKRHSARELPALAADGRQWCVGMGGDATSGWPGTDWVEDILLQQQGKAVYQDWATGRLPWNKPGSPVDRAWRTWGELFTHGSAKAALLTDFRAAGKKLFAKDPPCALEHQGSFVRASYARTDRARFRFSAGLLPGADPRSTAREVSGDFAAMFRNTQNLQQAKELMRYLTSDEAQRVWAESTGQEHARPFSAHSRVPVSLQPDDGVGRPIARALKSSRSLCLDASDSMPTRMRLAFQRAVLEYLSDTGKDPGRLLDSLERVRKSIHDEDSQPWLSAVCG